MIIDVHTHAHPQSWADQPFWKGRCPMVIENVIAAQEQAGVDLTVISNAYHEAGHADRAQQLEGVKELNRFLAEMQDRYAGKVVALASCIPGGGDEFIEELERAIRVDGLKGVMIASSVHHAYPDANEADPFFKLITDLDVPVMIHPPAIGYGEEAMGDYRLASSVGRPFDNCLALARLIVRGIFEKYPTVKIIGTHLGGGICEIVGRMDYAYELQEEAFFLGKYEPMLIRKKPSDYLKMMYLDSVSYHLPALRCVVETMGADHVLFGSDAPPLAVLKPKAVQLVRDLGLSEADERKLFEDNVRRLFKLN